MFGKRSDQPRTAEDRARAAANRAARRAGQPLPQEAFEHTVRPPDVEPHEPLHRDDEPLAWEEDAPPPSEEAPSIGSEVAPARGADPLDAAAPARGEDPLDAAAPARGADPLDAAALARGADPLDEIAPPRGADPLDAAAPARGADPLDAAAPARGADPLDEIAPSAESAPSPAAPLDDVALPAAEPPTPAPDDAADAVPAGDASGEDARAAAAAEARTLRDSTPQPADDPPREEAIHQPTVEYTPFQTEEHALPEAPLGEPRDGEPRLVAARGFPGDHDEVRAFAAAGSRPDPEVPERDETERRPPAPLRKAPDRPADAGATPRRAAPKAPRGRSRTPKALKTPSGGARWGRRIFTLLVVLVFAVVLYGFNQTFQPLHGDGSGSAIVNIPENTDTKAVAKLLKQAGVIDSARFFELNATISGDRDKLRPGHYTLKKGMTNGAVIAALTKVPANPKAAAMVSVTLIEGPSRKENAPVVDKSKKVEGSYAKASSSAAVLKRIRALGAPKGTKTAEGFLFPATYEVEVGSSATELVNQQLDAFAANFKQVDMTYAKRKKLTRYDVLIIASMIEREVSVPRERALVSAVIYNRLQQGMPLGIDATIRYATDNWQRPIRQSELDKPGPYNSRLNRSLPPTPIGNPGLASLKAAAKPSSKKYLFYVRKPGKSGEHAFSTTDAQFEKDRQRYEASRKGQ